VTARCPLLLIAAWLVLVASATAAGRSALVVEDSVLRTRPGRWSRVVGEVRQGDRVLVQQDDGRRARVRRGERTGWLRADRIEPWPTADPPPSGAETSWRADASSFSGDDPADPGSPTPLEAAAPVRPGAAGLVLTSVQPASPSAPTDENCAPSLPAEAVLRLSQPRDAPPAAPTEASAPRILLLRTQADLGAPPSGTCRAGERLTLSAGDGLNGFTHLRCAGGASGWVVTAALVPTAWMARR
jgi:hypothetical protein